MVRPSTRTSSLFANLPKNPRELTAKVPASDELNYLYVLDIAAYKAGNTALDQKAAARMLEELVGRG